MTKNLVEFCEKYLPQFEGNKMVGLQLFHLKRELNQLEEFKGKILHLLANADLESIIHGSIACASYVFDEALYNSFQSANEIYLHSIAADSINYNEAGLSSNLTICCCCVKIIVAETVKDKCYTVKLPSHFELFTRLDTLNLIVNLSTLTSLERKKLIDNLKDVLIGKKDSIIDNSGWYPENPGTKTYCKD